MVNLLKSITVYIILLAFLLIIANCGVEDAEKIIKDTTPPDTSITSQPLNLTNSTSANFSFTSTEDGSTFECQIDSGDYTTCTSPINYTLKEGSHTFNVRAIDTANNTDPTPASYTWTIDTTAVEISITSQPSNPTNSTSATTTTATFIFTSTETATFECQIDSGGYTTCTSPKKYIGLAEGSHTFDIKATDAAGNTNLTLASYTWTIDTTAPDTNITVSPSILTNSTSASFSFTSEMGSTFQCQIDSGGYTTCTSPKEYTGLSENSHTFEVRAIDTANNTDQTPASYTWTIETTAPTGSISINNGATYTSSTSVVTLTLSASDISGVATMQFSNDNTNWSTAETYATSKEWILSTGEDGTRTVYVKFKDNLGNWTTIPATDSITLDTKPPTGTISINSDATYTNSVSVTLTLSCTDSSSGCSQMQFSNDNSTWSTAETYSTGKTWTLSTGDGDGIKTVYVKFKDNAGNWTTTTTTISNSITLDTIAPTVSSTTPDNNATGVAVNTTITATFSEAMDNSTITTTARFTLTQGTTSISGTVNYSGKIATFTPSEPPLSSYNTTYTATITKEVKDLAGNAMTNDYTWNFKTTPIILTWNAPTKNVDGTSLDYLAGYKVYYGTSTGNYTTSIDVGNFKTYTFSNLSAGTYYFVVTAYDTMANESDYSNEVSKTTQ